MIRATDSSSTFELAKYAEALLSPLVKQIPGGSLQIEMNLGMPFFSEYGSDWSISFSVYANSAIGNQGNWVAWGSLVGGSEEVDWKVLEVRQYLEKMKAAA
ncbi:hypothetical protein [Glutamicibacter sp.]|uniref:hypothetical protein n=1 Tax=Glutamicibacter sp. TaxID=1931995 RepID=UPI002FE3AA5D